MRIRGYIGDPLATIPREMEIELVRIETPGTWRI
jgi:hypothetical protein